MGLWARAPAKSSLALHDRLQRPAGLAGVIAQGSGDARVAGQPQDGDGKVAQAGHLGAAGREGRIAARGWVEQQLA